MSARGAAPFEPRRVLAVDLDRGSLEWPDPTRTSGHPRARVLVRWLGDPVGEVDVLADDDHLVQAVATAAWDQLRLPLERAALRHRAEVPRSAADLRDRVRVGGEGFERGGGPDLTASGSAGPLATVTIASLRNVEPTLACVRRVLAGSYDALEVVVVDNDDDHSVLDAALRAAFAGDPRVRWVHEPRRGLSRARNAGLAAARGQIVVFTDDDVRVDHRWLERLVAGFDAAPGVGCVTGSILPAELETRAQAWLEEYGGFNKGFEPQVFDLVDNRRPTSLYPYDSGQFGSGANMAFRREVIESLGGFAVDLGAGTPAHGGEDLDVLRRTVSAGHTVVYEPAALMWHFHRRSVRALRRQMYRYGVGLSATVTRWMVHDRRAARDIALRLLPGLAHVASPRSSKNENKTTFPRWLSLVELLGVAVGPAAYALSALRRRR